MEPSDALSRVAQIAVAFAGLIGVVVVRRGTAVHAWPQADKFRLKLLLSACILPLALCLLGLVLLSTSLPPPTVWSWCSGIGALLLFTGLLAYTWSFLKISAWELSRVDASALLYWSVSALGLITCLLLVYNAVALKAFWPFFAFIILELMVALAQFIRFMLARTATAQ